ncbi:hypothetical protein BLL52_2017 [Rhodoferax antarcticus ANT.BR]|uniref:Uncharacterized protein n=1 Tax=Rhodoferax antarcticus ANT.BR TaxID=1111071 RepID=A0A1Q8YD86_9BURK|nr:hypothetical protein BLL52_2017 [Rhodoferax antarcticus ANT.BR]
MRSWLSLKCAKQRIFLVFPEFVNQMSTSGTLDCGFCSRLSTVCTQRSATLPL